MYGHKCYTIDERVTSLIFGNILSTSPVRVVTTILLPTASKTSTLSVFLVSQGLAVKAYGFDVRAPTGHRSITFPESSERKNFSTYVPTCGRQLKVLSIRRHHPYSSVQFSPGYFNRPYTKYGLVKGESNQITNKHIKYITEVLIK